MYGASTLHWLTFPPPLDNLCNYWCLVPIGPVIAGIILLSDHSDPLRQYRQGNKSLRLMHTASVAMLNYKVRANILLQHCYMRAKGLSTREAPTCVWQMVSADQASALILIFTLWGTMKGLDEQR